MLLTPGGQAGLIRFYFGAKWLSRHQLVPGGMLPRQQEGRWEVRAVPAPGGQRGIEGQRWWRGKGQMGGQPAEGVPSPRLQPPPPSLSSVLAPGGRARGQTPGV